jgi:hypothetical protein
MGINVTNNASSQELRVIAGSAITAGDLVVNSDFGSVFPASSGLTIAQNNNTTVGISAISAVAAQNTGTGSGGNSGFAKCMAQLGNGSIGFVYVGDGTTATTRVTLRFKNLQGGDNIPAITVTSDTSVEGARIIALGANNLIVSWIANSTLKFAIYSNAGAVVKAATTVATTSASDLKVWDIAALATGDFVVTYRKVTSNDLEFQRYDSTGTAAGSVVTVEATSSAIAPTLMLQSSGDFVVYYYRSASTAAYKFARYNSTGTLQGSLTTVFTGLRLTQAIANSGIIELSNGNFVLMASNSSAIPAFYIYSSTGSVVKTATSFAGTNSSLAFTDVSPAMCATATGFAICTRGSATSNYLFTYDNSGANIINQLQVAYTGLGSIGAASTFVGGILIDNGASGFALLQSSYTASCSPTYSSAIWTFSYTGASVGTPIVLRANANTTVVYSRWAIKTSDGTFVTTDALSNSTQTFGTYAIARKSVIGVAQESAAVAGTLRVGTQGTYNTNSSYSVGGNFDQRTATVAGTRGTVVGSTAVLFGVS